MRLRSMTSLATHRWATIRQSRQCTIVHEASHFAPLDKLASGSVILYCVGNFSDIAPPGINSEWTCNASFYYNFPTASSFDEAAMFLEVSLTPSPNSSTSARGTRCLRPCCSALRTDVIFFFRPINGLKCL
ncbi:hypothetical protein OG21DRAFT_285597 [Imleria badia]|nr:hypothetical protein OG21DRAFT_285597 [Imleria badia]